MEEGFRNSKDVSSLALVQSICKNIRETKQTVKEVTISKSNFLMLVFYLGELQPLVEDLSKEDLQLFNSFPVWTSLNRLENATNAVRRFTKECTNRSRIFLLYKIENLLNEIRFLLKDVVDGMAIVPDTLPQDLKQRFDDLRLKLEKARFYMEPNNQQTAKAIADGVAAHRVDEPFASNLLRRIAETLAVPLPAAAELKLELQRDFESLEWDIDNPDLKETKELCDLLAPAAVLADVRRLAVEENGYQRYGSLSVNSAFICPMTGQVMRDPVMVVEAGFTYEREAICEWFNRGHRTCPDTGKELESLELVPNYNLREAIEEFSDRASRGDLTNAIDIIREIQSISDGEIQDAVETIKSLSDTNPKYRRLIASMDGIEPLVAIVKQQKQKMPKVWDKVLKLLINIVAIGDEYRILTVTAGVIPTLIRHLWKNDDGDNFSVMQLLHEVSKVEEGVTGIIESEKSIICIVHATNHENQEIKSVATKILDNVCHNRREVAIKVASYQVFGPLVTMLSSGCSLEIRADMARAVVDLDVNEEDCADLINTGAIPPLLDLLNSGGNKEQRLAAAKALQHLSSMESSKVPICKAGAIPALVQFLSSEDQEIRLAVMGTLANLATDHQGAIEIDQEGAVLRLLSMLKLDLHTLMHEYALRTLECMAKESKTVRSTVKEHNEGTYLVTLLQGEDLTAPSRASILHLLSHLADDRENRECVALTTDLVDVLVGYLSQSVDLEEQESIMGIFAGLSKMPKRTEVLLNLPVLETLVKYLDCGTRKTQECAALTLSKLLESKQATIKEHLLVAKLGGIPALNKLLDEGSVQAKCSSATVLCLLSRNTPSLTEKLNFAQKIAGFLGLAKFRTCKVHAGKCSAKKTLCLIESGAALRMLHLLGEKEARTAERAIEALSTLIENDRNKAKGLLFLVKNNAISQLIGVMGKSPSVTEKAVKLIEQIFRDRRFRDEKYYSGSQTVLYKLIATGQGSTRRAAAQSLEHLGLFPKGSTYTN